MSLLSDTPSKKTAHFLLTHWSLSVCMNGLHRDKKIALTAKVAVKLDYDKYILVPTIPCENLTPICNNALKLL